MFSPDRYLAALAFAAERHLTQTVPGTSLPYLVHVVSVAGELLSSLPTPGIDPDLAVVCALLHDTLEDTPTSHAELAAQFGPHVADGVQALSKDATLPKPDRMADSLRRIRLQPPSIWAVKLADRITNLSSPPPFWTPAKRRAYLSEAQLIADTLGSASAPLDTRIRARIAAYARYL